MWGWWVLYCFSFVHITNFQSRRYPQIYPLLEPDNWLIRLSWEKASLSLQGVCGKTKQLKLAPGADFATQMTVTVGDALLIEWAATSSSLAVHVLQQLMAGTPGTKDDLDKIRLRLAKIKRKLAKPASHSNWYSLRSVALRLGSPFFLPNGTSYPEILTVAQQAKADAANAKAISARSCKA